MNETELIARLSKENVELRDLVKIHAELAFSITVRLTAVGAPLNDNILNFNPEQLKYLRRILEIAEQITEHYEG